MTDNPGRTMEAILRGAGLGVSPKNGFGGLAANYALAEEQAVTAQVSNGCPSGRTVEVIGIELRPRKKLKTK